MNKINNGFYFFFRMLKYFKEGKKVCKVSIDNFIFIEEKKLFYYRKFRDLIVTD